MLEYVTIVRSYLYLLLEFAFSKVICQCEAVYEFCRFALRFSHYDHLQSPPINRLSLIISPVGFDLHPGPLQNHGTLCFNLAWSFTNFFHSIFVICAMRLKSDYNDLGIQLWMWHVMNHKKMNCSALIDPLDVGIYTLHGIYYTYFDILSCVLSLCIHLRFHSLWLYPIYYNVLTERTLTHIIVDAKNRHNGKGNVWIQ